MGLPKAHYRGGVAPCTRAWYTPVIVRDYYVVPNGARGRMLKYVCV